MRRKRRTLGWSHKAWSGGWMWAPLNPLSQADGLVEDIDEPRTYLKHALGANYDEPRVEALLHNAPHMVAFFQNKTSLQFVSGSWIADIQGDLRPGPGRVAGQVGPKPFNERRLRKRHCGLNWSGHRCMKRRSSGWGSWPARTCRRSCAPRHRSRVSSTPRGGSRSTSFDLIVYPRARHAVGERAGVDRAAGEIRRRARGHAVDTSSPVNVADPPRTAR